MTSTVSAIRLPLSALFDDRPEQFGLRGDAPLWDFMRWELSETPLPGDPDDAEARVRDLFGHLVGVDPSALGASADRELDRDAVTIDWLPANGMSGGQVDLGTWADRLFPRLRAAADGLCREPWRSDDAPLLPGAEHRFRFAAWAASRAASSSTCRFSVGTGVRLLRDHRRVRGIAIGSEWLPHPSGFDREHAAWRAELVESGRRAAGAGFSHGIAAKLINVYLKTLFLPSFGSYEDGVPTTILDAVHPPIDRLLLARLAGHDPDPGRRARWRRLRNHGWSRFGSEEYEEAIRLARELTGGRLWLLEAYWPGHQ